jgi:hypothetical protein
MKWLLVLASFCSAAAATGNVGPQGITLQGTILTPANQPEEAASVTFTLQVVSPGSEDCLLYQETQTVNMTSSSGAFSLVLGSGTRSGVGFQSTSTLAQIFNNSSGTISSLTCASGSSYTPNSSDSRKIVLTFDDGSGPQTLSPSLSVESVPFALMADSLQGKAASDLINVNTSSAAVSQANLESVFQSSSNVTQLLALINGTSSLYSTPSGTNAFTGGVSFSSPPTLTTEPTSANQVANKKYCDSTIAGDTADTSLSSLSNSDSGKVIEWNGSKWVAQTVTVSGSSITSGTIGGSTSVSTTGSITTSSSIGTATAYLYDHSGAGPGYIGLQAPTNIAGSGGASYTLKLPNQVASAAGQVLTASDTSGNLTWATPTVSSQPYVIGGTYVGTFGASQILVEHPMPIAVSIPSGCTNSRFEFSVAASASTTISLQKCTGSGFTSCTQFGTAVIAAAGKVATFSCTATSFVAGTDSLVISGPSTADLTASNAGWAIYGTR